MDSNINFNNYSLDELYDSSQSIDRDVYPERAKIIDDLIILREKEQAQECTKQEVSIKNIPGEKSTRWDRLWAGLIDAVIHMTATIPLFLYFGMEAFKDPSFSLIMVALVYGLSMTLILQGYLLHNYGQTIGKHIIGIRIENLDGTKADIKKIFLLRLLPMSVCSVIPVVGQFITGFINPIFIFGKERRCLHDYIAKTKVCYIST
ncbi:RDD family protein [Colwellia sp. 75C3]|uniref:RDD family protein n=1 Tax=Colwellia sp. 75C3 TaxID=888425 RepID=UPI000C328CD2|nr:RDD family protein [Colwellia sp. 75C3]PKG84278.1 RDD family protein [Colwellia sp. 75C3]